MLLYSDGDLGEELDGLENRFNVIVGQNEDE